MIERLVTRVISVLVLVLLFAIRRAAAATDPNVTVVTIVAERLQALEADRDPVTFRFEPDWLGIFKMTRADDWTRSSTVIP